MIEVFLVYLSAIALGWPLGFYLKRVMSGERSIAEPLFTLIEAPLYFVLGRNNLRDMTVKSYVLAFLVSNLFLGIIAFLIFRFQGDLPLNPNAAPSMSWDLALHTAISFLTNTNQQHYSGQAQLSYLAHMTGIVGLQFITPIMGLAMVVATLRKLFPANAQEANSSPGNYWQDLIRPGVRFFLPLCLVWTALLVSQGVPATLEGGPTVQMMDQSSGVNEQKIPLGPVAPMVAIKQLGTNGGGWYGPNSSVPLENPTPLSNFLESLAIILIPVSVIFMIAPLTGRPKFAALVFGVMLSMSMVSSGLSIVAENNTPDIPAGSLMEGKEQRFSVEASAQWSSFTTQTSNGSVNTMHDSLSPLAGMVSISNMLINSIWGGVGCGLAQFLVYLLLAVFLSGLMTGRTPEFFGRKLEASEVRLLGVLVILQPLVILGFTALTYTNPSLSGVSNPGFHGLSQVLYEYTSAYANNGSGFEGLADASVWWNVTASIALLLGRYPTLILLLLIAAQLSSKKQSPSGEGVLRIESLTLSLTLVSVIVILTLLQFMPVLVLGPIAEHFTLIN